MRYRSLHAIALASTILLAACGGGGDEGSSSPNSNAGSNAPGNGSGNQPAPVSVQGSAPAVTADPLAIIYMGPNGSSSNLFSANPLTTSNSAAASSQTAIPGGGYSAFNIGSLAVSLTQGTVTDIAGTADYQTGRWTNGQGQNVATMSANQGAYYIVGKPLALNTSTTAGTFSCQLASATKPTAVNGSTAPGSVSAATATIDKTTLNATMTLSFSIGAVQNMTVTKNLKVGGFASGSGSVFVSTALGSDATKPLLGFVYTVNASSAGDTSGSVVLSCQ